jgi:glucose/mannose-6-phosphate isomerase
MATTENATLDRETIARLDTSDLVTDVLDIPEHLRDALWKVESAGLRPWDSPGGLVVAGMGGSGIGGPLARAILGDQASRPLLGARAYGLPPWTTPDTTVLCASYSGNTEETLACYEAAGIIGAGASWSPPVVAWPSWRAPTGCPSSPWPGASSPAPPWRT